ncbi:MAG: hypothetical protein JW870_13415 [Candidatus Delongbacteria bacterium]|nr:hypothetical protein [Candidatus Delongbacteria bacterium]
MRNGNRLMDRLDRIEKQLFQANILLLVLIAICLLGFTGLLGFALVVLFWVGLIIGSIYLVMAIIDKIMTNKAQKRMEQKFHEIIEKAKAEKQES